MSSKRGRRQASSVLSSAGGTVGGVGAVAAKAARPSSGASDALMASLTTTLVEAMSSPGGDADYASAAATGDVKKTRRPRDMEEELIEAQAELKRREAYIKGVQRNYDTIAQLCSKNLENIAALTAELEEKKTILEKLQKSESDFASGKEAAVKLKQETAKLQAQVNEYEEQTKMLSKKCLDYQSHISDLNDIKEELSRQVEEMQALAQSRKDEIAELQFLLKDEDGQRQLQELNQRQEQLQNELAQALEVAEALRQDLRARELSFQKAQNVLRRMEMDKDNYQNDVQRIRDLSASTRTELVTVQRQLEEERRKNESLEIDNHSLANKCKMLSNQAPELEERVRFAEAAKKALQDQFDVLNQEKKDVDMNCKELKDEVFMLQVQLSKLVSETGRKTVDLERQLENSMKGKLDLVRDKSEATALKEKADERAKELQEEVDALTRKNQALRKQRSELEVRITDLEQEHHEWKEQRERLLKKQSTNAELVSEINQLKDEVRLLQNTIEEKNAELAVSKSEVTNTKADNMRLQHELTQLREGFDSKLKARLRDVEDRHSAKVDKFQAELSNLSRKLIKVETQNSEMSALLDEARSQMPKRLSGDEAEALRAKERELLVSVSKIISVEEASEASFTCVTCMDLFESAVTCIPCGHSYCAKCIKQTKICPQCGPGTKITYYPNELLEDLTTKFRFRKTSLVGLKAMIASQGTGVSK